MVKPVISYSIFSLISLGILCLGCFIYYLNIRQSEIILKTVSPSENYEVILTGQKKRPVLFGEVFLSVKNEGKDVVSQLVIHSGDFFDISFELGYPDYKWIDNQIIQFYKHRSDGNLFEIKYNIQNRSSETITYAFISSSAKTIVLTINGYETKSFREKVRLEDQVWVCLEAKFVGGRKIKNCEFYETNKTIDILIQ